MKIQLQTLSQQLTTQLSVSIQEREAKSLCHLLLSHFLYINRTDLIINKEVEVTDRVSRAIESAVKRLLLNEPVQYIFGEEEFYGLTFKVSPSVLIPRPETEELVQLIINENPSANSILDIGTGSGCIPISLKKHLPKAEVHAIDISEAALAIAKENAQNLDTDISFYQIDILSKPQLKNKFDIIVSNPPYVTEHEKTLMQHNVLDFEPHLALFVPNKEALKFYIAIADFALLHLSVSGKIYFEINEHFGTETADMLKEKGFKNVIVHKDFHEKNRMISANI